MPIAVDNSNAPIVIYNWPVETTDDDIVRYLESTEDLLKRRVQHVKVNNMLVNKTTTAKQRATVAEWIGLHRDALKTYRLGFAFVATEPTASMVRAVAWRTPYPYPWEIFDALTPALIWCCERIKENGLPIPAALRGRLKL